MNKDPGALPHKILIVDDEEGVRASLNSVLAGAYQVFTASDGGAALEIIKNEQPALVFMDINMPGMGGMETLKQIRQAGFTPVIWMLTGVEDIDTVIQTLGLGATGYLTKPLDIERIRNIVMDVFGETGATDRSWEVKKSEPATPS